MWGWDLQFKVFGLTLLVRMCVTIRRCKEAAYIKMPVAYSLRPS